jgi:hypothetical protein
VRWSKLELRKVPALTGRRVRSANEPAEETDAEEPRRLVMSYEEFRIPEELGERALKVLGPSPLSRSDVGS